MPKPPEIHTEVLDEHRARTGVPPARRSRRLTASGSHALTVVVRSAAPPDSACAPIGAEGLGDIYVAIAPNAEHAAGAVVDVG